MTVKAVWPKGSMALLTQLEADSISHSCQGERYDLYRNCSLAVLNSGNLTDNSKELLDNYQNFEIDVVRTERGLKIELLNPPKSSMVDGEIIESLQRHLYSVLRDIVQISASRAELEKLLGDRVSALEEQTSHDLTTNIIFHILRNAGALIPNEKPNIAVCWGGHSISQREYDYAYKVGYALGLRRINVCTGCGPGIMEAPMKGAVYGHVVQRAGQCRCIGLTEPSIIAAEPPNPMVSELIIMPDIEKRLEAFVRLGHALIAFPGGPGTAEELLYILGIKLCRENRHNPLPLILTGDEDARPYFETLDRFFKSCFGDEIARHYRIIINDPNAVAEEVKLGLENALEHRTLIHDSYCYNWSLYVPDELQHPFDVTHENMAALNLRHSEEPQLLAAWLRRAFSGIVTGNVKEHGIALVAKHGPFTLHGDKDIIESMDHLMRDFIAQGRILLSNRDYVPCYTFEPD